MTPHRARFLACVLSMGSLAAQGLTDSQPQVWPRPAPGTPTLQRFSQAVIQRWGADYIRISYFIDPTGLKGKAGEDPVTRLRKGRIWSGTRLTFLTGISGEKRRSVFDTQLKQFWPGGHFDPQRPTVQQFLRATTRRLNRGDRLDYLLDPAGIVRVRHGQEPWTAIKDPQLMLALLGLNYVDGPENAATIQLIVKDLESFAAKTP